MSRPDRTPASPPLVILVPDGAAEPGRVTSLERARTPHLDVLCAEQGVGRLTTIPAGWHPGTEVGVARLMGIAIASAPGRGWLEAAAGDVEVGEARAAWRLDLTVGHATAEQLTAGLRVDGDDAWVGDLPGHRHLLVGPESWGDAAVGHDRPLPPSWQARLAPVEIALGVGLHAWGRVQRPSLPLRCDLAVAPASSAVRGLARLVGATLLDSLEEALATILAGTHATVLIHDAGPDEAAHARAPRAKVAAIERFDAAVVGPVLAVAGAVGAAVIVAPDHGCDPASGSHTADPVPATWPGAPGVGRLTEPATADVGAVDVVTTVHRRDSRRKDAA